LRLPGQIPRGQAIDVALALSTDVFTAHALTVGALTTGAFCVEAPGPDQYFLDGGPVGVDLPGGTP
jgi:hypothetical protein